MDIVTEIGIKAEDSEMSGSDKAVLGLGRNEVRLSDHNPEWRRIADKTIVQLWKVFGSAAEGIQHVGSTAIKHIKAKPDMVIVVGVKNLDVIDEILPRLHEIGISKMDQQSVPDTVKCGITSENESGVHTQYVLILIYNSIQWQNYVNFRDYLNAFPHKAAEYESLKISLAKQHPNDRKAYKNGKLAFFEKTYVEARIYKDAKPSNAQRNPPVKEQK